MKNKTLLLLIITAIIFSSCNIVKLQKEFLSESHHYEAENVFVSIGWGGNSGIIEFSDLVIIIDTKMNSKAEKYYKSIEDKLTNKKIYIINTHLHFDHTGGNYLFNADTIFIPNYTDELWNKENLPQNNIDSLPYVKVKEEITIEKNGYIIKIIPTGTGHTANDLIVLIENEKILFAGDLFFNGYHPVLSNQVGAKPLLWAEAIINICKKYEFETVIPGHGQVSDKTGFLKQAEYFSDINKAILTNDKKEQKKIKRKYRELLNLPNLTSYKKTVEYIK